MCSTGDLMLNQLCGSGDGGGGGGGECLLVLHLPVYGTCAMLGAASTLRVKYFGLSFLKLR